MPSAVFGIFMVAISVITSKVYYLAVPDLRLYIPQSIYEVKPGSWNHPETSIPFKARNSPVFTCLRFPIKRK